MLIWGEINIEPPMRDMSEETVGEAMMVQKPYWHPLNIRKAANWRANLHEPVWFSPGGPGSTSDKPL